MFRVRARLATLLCALIATHAARTRAAQLDVYILDVTDQSSFATYRVPTPVFDFFGPTGVGLPFNGLSVGGLNGIEQLTTSASGPLMNTGAASNSGSSIFGAW